jgi:hypothetical protein
MVCAKARRTTGAAARGHGGGQIRQLPQHMRHSTRSVLGIRPAALDSPNWIGGPNFKPLGDSAFSLPT